MNDKEIKPGQNRFISVTCCAECPLNGKCNAWEVLDSKQKVFLNLSNSVPIDFMLSNCPLTELPEQSSPSVEYLRKQRDELIDIMEKEVVSSVSAPFKPHLSGVFAVIRSKINNEGSGHE